MRTPKSWRTAMALVLGALTALAVAAVPRGSAQTMYPSIWGISNMGETCSGWCHGGPRGGQWICCRVETQPAPPAGSG
jgi:hypothetical protein